MLVQTPMPPPLQKIASSRVLASETPAGYHQVKVTHLAPNKRVHTLGGVRFDFAKAHTSESESYALMKTHAAAVGLARREAKITTGGLFHTRATAIRRFAVGVTAQTAAGAKAFLALAVARLRRSERW